MAASLFMSSLNVLVQKSLWQMIFQQYFYVAFQWVPMYKMHKLSWMPFWKTAWCCLGSLSMQAWATPVSWYSPSVCSTSGRAQLYILNMPPTMPFVKQSMMPPIQPYEPSLNCTGIMRLFNDDNPSGNNHPQQCQISKRTLFHANDIKTARFQLCWIGNKWCRLLTKTVALWSQISIAQLNCCCLQPRP